MRVLILSDVHANLIALEAVLADAAGQYDEIWNLGDTVGYGPEPVACIERLNQVARIQLAGNHDLACAGVASMEDFNPVAKAASNRTGRPVGECRLPVPPLTAQEVALVEEALAAAAS